MPTTLLPPPKEGCNRLRDLLQTSLRPPTRISDVPTALILFAIRPCAEGRSTGGSQQAGLTLFP